MLNESCKEKFSLKERRNEAFAGEIIILLLTGEKSKIGVRKWMQLRI